MICLYRQKGICSLGLFKGKPKLIQCVKDCNKKVVKELVSNLSTCKKAKQLNKVLTLQIEERVCLEIYEQRLMTCKNCEHRQNTICKKGNIWITISAWLPDFKCPKGV